MDNNVQNNSAIDDYKFGTFWIIDRKKYIISRTLITQTASQLGFCLFRGSIHQIIGRFIKEVDERKFQDALRNYIKGDEPIVLEIRDALESFLQKNGKFTISALPIMPYESLLHDTKDTCYKFFKNGVIKIEPNAITPLKYTELPEGKYILASKVQNRNYAHNDTGRYLDFLQNATDWKKQKFNIQAIIGYLSHEYKDETTAYIIVLTEQCPDPKDGGGSGKNLFCNLLSHTTTYLSKNAKQIKYDEKFFQSWNGQRIMGISDAPKNFDFEFLKEPSSGMFTLKKLFKDEVEIPVQDGPKFIIQTNFSYEITDGGLKRRIKPIEFTDFFTRKGGVDVHYGMHFPGGWEETDWNNFDTIIIESIQVWLSSQRKIQAAALTETGWRKQFEHTHGFNLTTFISDHFEGWVEKSNVPSEDIKSQINTFYLENDVSIKYHYSSQKISTAIKEWAKHFGYDCKANVQVKYWDINKKSFVFTPHQ